MKNLQHYQRLGTYQRSLDLQRGNPLYTNHRDPRVKNPHPDKHLYHDLHKSPTADLEACPDIHTCHQSGFLFDPQDKMEDYKTPYQRYNPPHRNHHYHHTKHRRPQHNNTCTTPTEDLFRLSSRLCYPGKSYKPNLGLDMMPRHCHHSVQTHQKRTPRETPITKQNAQKMPRTISTIKS